jgi:hypothetical protein
VPPCIRPRHPKGGRAAPETHARRKLNVEYRSEALPRAQAGVIAALRGLWKIPEILAGRRTLGHPRELAIASLWRQMGPKSTTTHPCPGAPSAPHTHTSAPRATSVCMSETSVLSRWWRWTTSEGRGGVLAVVDEHALLTPR